MAKTAEVERGQNVRDDDHWLFNDALWIAVSLAVLLAGVWIGGHL